jgi:hypothetical protein
MHRCVCPLRFRRQNIGTNQEFACSYPSAIVARSAVFYHSSAATVTRWDDGGVWVFAALHKGHISQSARKGWGSRGPLLEKRETWRTLQGVCPFPRRYLLFVRLMAYCGCGAVPSFARLDSRGRLSLHERRPRRLSLHAHSRYRENLFSDGFSCWLLIRPQGESG